MKLRTERGSIIAFSIILLSILLTAGLSVASVASLEKRSGLATEKSIVAFQAADSGTERVLERIYIYNNPSFTTTPLNGTMPDSTLLQVARNLTGIAGGATCNDTTNKITATNSQDPRYTFQVSFFDGSDVQITCNDTAWRDKTVWIRTEGFFRQTARVLELGIKPRPLCDATNTATDADGRIYGVVQIGDQCWLDRNMDVGGMIPSATPQTNNGGTNTIEKYCYNNQLSNCTSSNAPQTEPDGGLYTWDEAMQYVTTERTQGICPVGWHIPTDAEWYILENFLKDDGQICDASRSGGGCATAGVKLSPGGSAEFEGNYAGFYDYSDLQFKVRYDGIGGSVGVFLTSTKNGAEPVNRIITHNTSVGALSNVLRSTLNDRDAASVRCIMD